MRLKTETIAQHRGEFYLPGDIMESRKTDKTSQFPDKQVEDAKASGVKPNRKSHPDLRLCRSYDAALSRKNTDESAKEGHTRHHSLLRSKSDTPPLRSQSEASIGSTYAMQKASGKSPLASRRLLPKIRKNKGKTSSSPKPWTQKEPCTWANANGRTVVLDDLSLLDLSEKERQFLHKVSMSKLQSLDLGCNVTIPKGNGGSKRGKRLFSISRKRSSTTHLAGIIDNIKDNFKDRGKDKENKTSSDCGPGYVFGIPLWRCISNDVVLKRRRLSLLKERTDNDSGNMRRSTGYRRSSSDSNCSSFDVLDHNGERSGERSENKNASCDSLLDDGDRSPRIERSPSLVEALSLQAAVNAEMRRQSLTPAPPQIPHVIKCCFQHLKTHGMQTLGIFRVGGSKKRTKQLREEFDSGKDVRLTSEHSPHDVGALLKEFFRDLPEPLLTRELYNPFVATRKITDLHQQTKAMQCLISLLPPANRDTLWALLNFLSVVVEHSTDTYDENGIEVQGNKMDSHNLATLFGPNVLHKAKSGVDFQVESAERAEDRRDIIEVVQDMVDMQREFFNVGAETYNEVIRLMLESEPESADYVLRKRLGHENVTELKDDDDTLPSSEYTSSPRPRAASEAMAYTERRRTPLNSDSSKPSRIASEGSRRESSSSRTRKISVLRPPDLTITSIGDEVFVSDYESDTRGSCLTPDSAIHSPMRIESETLWNSHQSPSGRRSPYQKRKSGEFALKVRETETDLLKIKPRSRGSSPVPARSRSPRTDRSDSFSNCPDNRRSSTGSTSSSLQRPLMAPIRTSSIGCEWQANKWQHWERMASNDAHEPETLV